MFVIIIIIRYNVRYRTKYSTRLRVREHSASDLDFSFRVSRGRVSGQAFLVRIMRDGGKASVAVPGPVFGTQRLRQGGSATNDSGSRA